MNVHREGQMQENNTGLKTTRHIKQNPDSNKNNNPNPDDNIYIRGFIKCYSI